MSFALQSIDLCSTPLRVKNFLPYETSREVRFRTSCVKDKEVSHKKTSRRLILDFINPTLGSLAKFQPVGTWPLTTSLLFDWAINSWEGGFPYLSCKETQNKINLLRMGPWVLWNDYISWWLLWCVEVECNHHYCMTGLHLIPGIKKTSSSHSCRVCPRLISQVT